jgi:hypothetical protein
MAMLRRWGLAMWFETCGEETEEPGEGILSV